MLPTRGEGQEMDILYGVAETIGLRGEMEDAHWVGADKRTGVFSAEVCDGHAGSLAATIAAQMLTPCFLLGEGPACEKTGREDLPRRIYGTPILR